MSLAFFNFDLLKLMMGPMQLMQWSIPNNRGTFPSQLS